MGVHLPARRLWLLPAIALASVLAASAAYLAPVYGRSSASQPLPSRQRTPGPLDTGRAPPAGIPPPWAVSGSPAAGPASDGAGSGGSAAFGSGGFGSGGSGGLSGGVGGPLAVRYGFEGEGHLAMRVYAAAGGAVRT